jgi:HK97 family phage major capsid protein
MKTIAEQLVDLKATRQAKQERLGVIAQKSIDESRSMNTAESEEFETGETELKQLDLDIARLSRLEAINKASAQPAAATATDDANRIATDGANAREPVQVKHTEKLEPGIGFARVARCKALAQEHKLSPLEIAKNLYPQDDRLIGSLTMKVAAHAASTLNAPWMGNLIADGAAFADFVEFLRPQTLLGRVESRLRRLPFDVPVAIQSTGGSASWVGEGAAKPVTEWTYTQTILRPTKVAAIAVATQEMLNRASTSVDTLIRDELARAIRERLDIDFIDPAKAAVANVSPASILNGVAPLTSAGNTPEDVRCDLAVIMGEFADANLTLSGAFWVMNERTAIALSLMQNPLGQSAFPGVNFSGGTLLGLPVFVTNYANTDSDGAVVALVNGSDIYLGDEGGIQISVSDQASIQMDTAPTNNGVTPTATALVSFWQDNLIGWRVERFITWARRRAQAVVWMRVNWTSCTP